MKNHENEKPCMFGSLKPLGALTNPKNELWGIIKGLNIFLQKKVFQTKEKLNFRLSISVFVLLEFSRIFSKCFGTYKIQKSL
jgi:uncharacterized Tic20 family protein